MCGIGNWRPICLQVFANFKFAFFIMCMANFLFSFGFSIFITAMSSIQMRYSLQSVLMGLNATLFDGATLISVLFVSFLCGRPNSHRPRIIGLSLTLGALSLGSVSLAHFISGPYNYSSVVLGVNDTTMCAAGYGKMESGDLNNSSLTCSKNDEKESLQMTVLMLLGHTLAGIFYTPLVVLAPTYIDDCVGKLKAPLYLAIFYGMFTVGPVVGFPFSSIFVGQYVDFDRVDMSTIDLTPYDPRWVGAWWLGFVVESVLTVCVAIPMVFLPKKFAVSPDSDESSRPKLMDRYNEEEEDEDEVKMGQEALSRFREIPSVLGKLFTNVPLISISIAYGLECAITSGLVTYSTKYVELQFRISASKAAFLTGIALVVSSSVGIFAGGYIMRRLKMTPLSMARLLLIFGIITAILPIPILFLGCETDTFAGVSVPYREKIVLDTGYNSTGLGYEDLASLDISPLESTCNLHCGCSESDYDPVCGSDGITYYSPCFAGCTEASTTKNFSSCSCVGLPPEGGDSAVDINLEGGTAIAGICGQRCETLLVIFILCCFVASFISALPLTAYIVLPLRVVEQKDKPFAVGIRQLFAQFIGWVPTPIYMGYIIDSACLHWGTSECSVFSSCLVYDLYDYRLKLMTFEIVLKIAAVAMYLTTWLSMRRRPEFDNYAKAKQTEINEFTDDHRDDKPSHF
ncbi:solute carrier organic anion transporter family member 5A1-like [Ptychodera flava]|uniref:solute carrier organic anion transporter family member 5A1-like n=1 Tax=Ptychodera flava TaxID=63121 RepID=UPI00396AAFAA